MNWTFYLLILTSIVVVIGSFLYFFQEKFIFLNGKRVQIDYLFEFSDDFEEVFLKTSDGNVINALHFKLEKPKGVVLFCHGNKGNLKKWGSKVSFFLNYNYEVVVFDYRKYGKSTGSFNETKMYDDALLMYNCLKSKFKEKTIVVYGFSLGSTFATRIAALNKPKELILEAPFFNFKSAVQYYSKFTPTFLLKYAFRTDLDILKVTVPITIFHGNKDKTTSFKDAKKLFALNTSLKNRFIAIKQGTHHNIRDSKFYKQKLQEILKR
jgi:alpha-beta hydrolase superfamily lysophospholipase